MLTARECCEGFSSLAPSVCMCSLGLPFFRSKRKYFYPRNSSLAPGPQDAAARNFLPVSLWFASNSFFRSFDSSVFLLRSEPWQSPQVTPGSLLLDVASNDFFFSPSPPSRLCSFFPRSPPVPNRFQVHLAGVLDDGLTSTKALQVPPRERGPDPSYNLAFGKFFPSVRSQHLPWDTFLAPSFLTPW